MTFRFRVKVTKYVYVLIEAKDELEALVLLRERERAEMASYNVLETKQVVAETP